MKEAYRQINGAVDLLEKFIRLFYISEVLNFLSFGNPEEMLYNKFEMACTIFHYLLAVDFFNNFELYNEFIDVAQDPNYFARLQTLMNHKKDANNGNCDENFEEIYGKMIHEIVFDPSIL